MKALPGMLIVVLLIALPVMSGCACGSKISADEAIAIVKQYELNRNLATIYDYRRGLGGEWDATYKGKGHWQVTSYVKIHDAFNGNPALYYLYFWDYYEDSGIIDYRGLLPKEQ